jgi:predicted ATPase/DNA-binding winged helix-turn-helix (wHTH) protein
MSATHSWSQADHMPAKGQSLVYESGEWEVDLARRELRARGTPVPLGSRAFEIVEVLVQSAGELVTKNDLIDRVWPGAIVEENTLQVHIHAVRKALGPDRGMLKTASGRGYRLTGDWEIRQESKPADAAALEPARMPERPCLTNLPMAASELIGLTAQAQQLRDLLSAYRAVTLTGPGGIGKTTLALEVARNLFPTSHGDVWLVDLVSLSDPDLVPSAVAGVLGLHMGGDEISPESVARAIGARKLLLVLDNCEHVVDAAARLAETVVRQCPRTSVLATSREVLRIEGEHVYRVPPLDVPPPHQEELDIVLGHSAVQLFIARTRALRSDFSPHKENLPAIAAICRRLDGIPLAIEFAAARAATLGARQVASHLNDRFRLLTGGRRTALPRHQTLRATLDWSYDLLPQSEQRLLRHLALFPAGFTLEAATVVMRDTGDAGFVVLEEIANLMAKSLVTLEGSTPVGRWRLLETIRAYALEKLVDSGEAEQAARRHAEYFQDLLERVESDQAMHPTAEWIGAYGHQVNDVRAALDWAFSPSGDATIGVALTIASERLWFGLSLMGEWCRRVESALTSIRSGAVVSIRLEMQLLAALGAAMWFTSGPRSKAGAAFTDVLEIAERLDDTEYRLRALSGLWSFRLGNAELQAAVALAQKVTNLPPDQAGPTDRLVGERMLATSLYYLGDQSNARRHIEGMLSRYAAPTSQPHISIIRFQYDQLVAGRGTLARILWLQGFPDQALRIAHDNVENTRAIDHAASMCIALELACVVVLDVGDLATTRRYVAMWLEHSAKVALGLNHAFGRWYEGALLIKEGDVVAGLRSTRAALDELRETGFFLRRPAFLGVLAEGLASIGQVAEGLLAIDDALAQCERTNERWNMSELLRIRGQLLLLEGAPAAAVAAEDHYRQGLDWARRQGALSWELRCATSLARLWRDQARSEEARGLLAPMYDRFTEGFATADLRAAKTLLDEVS